MNRLILAWVAVAVLPACSEDSSHMMWNGLDEDAVGLLDVARLGPVRLSADGPVVADGHGELPGARSAFGRPLRADPTALTLTVIDDGDRPAVRWSTSFVEMVLYVDRDDAVTWSVAPTQGGLAPGSTAVSFETGVPLELLDSSEDGALVRYSERDFWLDAWVPAYDVDQVRTEPKASTPISLAYSETAWIRPNTDLFDGAGGPWMGRFEPARPDTGSSFTPSAVPQERLGDAVNGFVPVAWTAPGVRAEVWVQEARLVDPPSGLSGFGGSYSFGSGCGFSLPSHTILADSPLYDGVGGKMVGQTLADVDLYDGDVVSASADGWLRYEVFSPWGPVSVWLDPDSVVTTEWVFDEAEGWAG
ncbi:MAG: hypothetical protein AB8H79_24815 [Myxococcota bacterium]